MKLHRLMLGTILAFLFIVALLYGVVSTQINGVAQVSTPWFGENGYTYWIKPPLEIIKVYNVMGQVKYGIGGPYGASKFQTYAVPQSTATISSFRKLQLRGRVYWDGETDCPLGIWEEETYHWVWGSGQKNMHILSLNNPDSYWPKFAVGKHRLIHDYAENSQGNPPQPFFIWNGGYNNPVPKSVWLGEGFGCEGETSHDYGD